MRCPRCEASLVGTETTCPRCSAAVETFGQDPRPAVAPPAQPPPDAPGWGSRAPRRAPVLPALLLLALAVAAVVAFFGGGVRDEGSRSASVQPRRAPPADVTRPAVLRRGPLRHRFEQLGFVFSRCDERGPAGRCLEGRSADGRTTLRMVGAPSRLRRARLETTLPTYDAATSERRLRHAAELLVWSVPEWQGGQEWLDTHVPRVLTGERAETVQGPVRVLLRASSARPDLPELVVVVKRRP